MVQPLADTLCTERTPEFVEALAAEAEGLGIHAVAQTDHAVAQTGKIRPLRFERIEKIAPVVGNFTGAVGGAADQVEAGPQRIQGDLIHQADRRTPSLVLQQCRNFLRDRLCSPAHRGHQNRQILFHIRFLPPISHPAGQRLSRGFSDPLISTITCQSEEKEGRPGSPFFFVAAPILRVQREQTECLTTVLFH
ncbi:hypothetical protein D3C85_1327830 [compost metagenome]